MINWQSILALRHSLWVILFSIQDRTGFLETIMRRPTQNNEEPVFSYKKRIALT
jgi:hypothetical protein